MTRMGYGWTVYEKTIQQLGLNFIQIITFCGICPFASNGISPFASKPVQ